MMDADMSLLLPLLSRPPRAAMPATQPLRAFDLLDPAPDSRSAPPANGPRDEPAFDDVWMDLVSWFDHQREWVELVARIEWGA